MENWFSRYALKFAIKEGLAIAFLLACGLAKFFPLFEDGYYQLDAILYLLLFGLAYLLWDAAR